MNNKLMTATEVQVRMDEANKRFTAPDFTGIINDIARRMRRATLLGAIQGSSQDRMSYCLSKATARSVIDFAAYGSALYDPNKQAELTLRWFARLERLARRENENK